MSALGQKETSAHVRVMSALPPKADSGTQSRNVRFVPKADMKESRNGGTSEFVSWRRSRHFRLIYLNERVARPLFVFVELNEKLAACKNM